MNTTDTEKKILLQPFLNMIQTALGADGHDEVKAAHIHEYRRSAPRIAAPSICQGGSVTLRGEFTCAHMI